MKCPKLARAAQYRGTGTKGPQEGYGAVATEGHPERRHLRCSRRRTCLGSAQPWPCPCRRNKIGARGDKQGYQGSNKCGSSLTCARQVRGTWRPGTVKGAAVRQLPADMRSHAAGSVARGCIVSTPSSPGQRRPCWRRSQRAAWRPWSRLRRRRRSGRRHGTCGTTAGA